MAARWRMPRDLTRCPADGMRSAALLPVLAAATALVVVHGFGRFYYTPLIPLLVEDGLLTLPEAASLASWNYVGYLLGALCALWLFSRNLDRSGLSLGLLLNALATLMQVQTSDYTALLTLRLVNGISNGVVFVLAPALVMEWLAARRQIHLSGLVYLGVGIGLIASYLLTEIWTGHLTGPDHWIPAALASLPLAIWSAWYLYRIPVSGHQGGGAPSTPLWDRQTTPLFLAYAGAGMGYILPMTFLPAVARDWGVALTPSPWLLVGLASLPSTWLWNHLGARIGDQRALLLNYAIQVLAVAALLWVPDQAMALWTCALLIGGSFLGAVLLTQRLARHLHPHQGTRLSAMLIALYGFTQLLGPWLSRLGLDRGMALDNTFVWGLGALIWAAAWMLLVPRDCHQPAKA